MPDMNELLRWSIANSTASRSTEGEAAPATQAGQGAGGEEQLSLRFNPASTTGATGGTSALHSSDYGPPDLSPASTPGPATPVDGTLPLPSISGAEGESGGRRNDLTTEMLDLIMGKSDSIVMKEKMEIATDESRAVEERVEALDDFEMLVELIDNANNMPILKLWDPLLALLSSPQPEIVAHSCWIIGTAVQNNLKAQAALYIHNALPLILSLIYPSSSSSTSSTPAVRAKATYALSSALKHWPLAASALAAPHSSSLDPAQSSSSSSAAASSSESGYTVLRKGVADSDLVIKRKMAFLVGTLTMQSGEEYEGEMPNEVRNLIEEKAKSSSTSSSSSESLVEGLTREGVFASLIDGLRDSTDVEYDENALRALGRAAEKGALTSDQKAHLRGVWEQWGSAGQEDRGLGGEDGKDVLRALTA